MSADYVKALDLAKQGDWDASHEIVQAHSDSFSCLIHAYLHRVEGDASNAAYWYRRAGEAVSTLSLDDELQHLYKRLESAGSPS